METSSTPAWTLEELESAVDAYLQMMAFEKDKQQYSKTEIRRKTLSSGLRNRSSSSFEFRMRNISAVVADLGFVPVNGYVAAANLGKNREVIEAILKSRLGLDMEATQLSSNEELLDSKVGLLLKAGVIVKPEGAITPAVTEAKVHRVFLRSVLVKAWVLQESAGICEGCQSPAPFILPNGQPFLEVHHVVPLAEGGADVVENTVALCPNCHRRCHLSADRETFTADMYSRIPRLARLSFT